jgi:hypothetical protein
MAKVPWNPVTAKLNQAARLTTKAPGAERFFLNKSGSHTANMSSSGQRDRVQKYAARRQLAVAKIMTIGELMRAAGAFDVRSGPVSLSTEGAFWQTVSGTELWPACHTAPALLLFDGHLPTILPHWADIPNQHAVAQQIVLTFADCVLMPQFVNRIDQALDENFGGRALVAAMELVVAGADALTATIEYQREMVSVYQPLLLTSPVELAYELGRLQPNAAPVTRESLRMIDPKQRLEEVAIINRLDDPNHQVLQILCDTNCRAPNAAIVRQLRELIERELH